MGETRYGRNPWLPSSFVSRQENAYSESTCLQDELADCGGECIAIILIVFSLKIELYATISYNDCF